MKILVFDRFTAAGATLDPVKAMFMASGFEVMALAEIVPADQGQANPLFARKAHCIFPVGMKRLGVKFTEATDMTEGNR